MEGDSENLKDSKGTTQDIQSYELGKFEVKGILAIINNMDYTRIGCHNLDNEKNSMELRETFFKLGFHVLEAKDLTGEQIVHFLENEVRTQINRNHEMFICALNGHGGEDRFYGIDGKSVGLHKTIIGISREQNGLFGDMKKFMDDIAHGKVDEPIRLNEEKWDPCDTTDIISIFDGKDCNNLKTKPKVFILDMCAGRENEERLEPVKTTLPTYVPTVRQGFSQGTGDQDAHFFVGRACTSGYISIPKSYINVFCNTVKRYRNIDLLNVHSDVSRVIMEDENDDFGKYIQTVNVISTLHKRLIFGEDVTDNIPKEKRVEVKVKVVEEYFYLKFAHERKQ